MKTTIDMAREAGLSPVDYPTTEKLKRFAELVRADEREQGQKWFDAVLEQHKINVLAEREACAKVCDVFYCDYCADAIRNRGTT